MMSNWFGWTYVHAQIYILRVTDWSWSWECDHQFVIIAWWILLYNEDVKLWERVISVMKSILHDDDGKLFSIFLSQPQLLIVSLL